jgi:hypothetical protein
MFKFLKINMILAHSLFRIPEMKKGVLLKEIFEYHGERDFLSSRKIIFFIFISLILRKSIWAVSLPEFLG